MTMAMTRMDFADGMGRLQRAFSATVKAETAAAYYEELGSHSVEDWNRAVNTSIRTEQHFPRISVLVKHLGEAAAGRHAQEWAEAQHRERQDAERLVRAGGGQQGWIRDIVSALTLSAPEERQAALAAIADVSLRAVPSSVCDCIDGLVFWTGEAGYSCVAACSACVAGTTQPKSFPRADPVTLEAIR